MKIQDHPQSFYEGFDIIIAGLDSIPARRWINATMVQIAQEGNVIPLIDGGTEGQLALLNERVKANRLGFKGQSRVILPTVNACYECTVSCPDPTSRAQADE
jgi:ubiquitin-activating enzyme E1 C